MHANVTDLSKKSHKLEIIWSYDESDCEDCGDTTCEGAVAILDGVTIIDQAANAHCTNMVWCSPYDVYAAALRGIGDDLDSLENEFAAAAETATADEYVELTAEDLRQRLLNLGVVISEQRADRRKDDED